MRSKLLILAILLLSIMVTGQALAATVTVTPSQVPKGAYVNGPGGATDDNYFWQAVKVEFADTHVDIATFLTIDLPTGTTVASTDGGALANQVSISYNTANDPVFVVTSVTASKIILDITTVGAEDIAAGDYVWVMFPVATETNPSVAGSGYAITFGNPGVNDVNLTSTTGPQITYRAAGALDISPFTTALAGDNDSTTTYGQKYPSTGPAALWAALSDLVKDVGEAQVDGAAGLTAMDADDTNDITYTLWASTDSTLSHVDVLTSGVTRAVAYAGPTPGANFTVGESETGNFSEIATAALPEGNYYFYLTSDFTGDFPIARSGQLCIRHYPEVKILGWDYNDDGAFDNEAAGGYVDDFDITLDTGDYYQNDNSVGTNFMDNLDLYINVDDYDDNARVYLFYSTSAGLTSSSIQTSGTSPNLAVTALTGATLLADTLFENMEDTDGFIVWNWSVAPIGNSFIPANTYTLYAVACDGKHTSLIKSYGADSGGDEALTIKHSPNLVIEGLEEYDPDGAAPYAINTANYDALMLTWGKRGINGDSDIDDSALISFYVVTDASADGNADYGSESAATIEGLPAGVHQIITGLSEDREAKASSYYTWDLKADYAATGWFPTAGSNYHLYAIIDENKTGGTKRVVALGDDGILDSGDNIKEIIFTNSTYARLYDPPADGVTVYGDQTYRMKFDAFDFDENANLGIWVVKTTGTGFTTGPATTTVATINTAGAGNMYCLTSSTGDDAAGAGYWLPENTSSYYDLTVRKPSEDNTRYATDNNAGPGDMTDGTYWVYIGSSSVGATLYRAPGIITFKKISDADDPAQKNLMLTPSVFTVSLGDTTTFTVSASDNTGAIDADVIDAYLAVEKSCFDVVSPSAPFTDVSTAGSLIANEVIDDATNNRWILHVTLFNSGASLALDNADAGSSEATFRLVSKGTTNALGASSSIYYVNEPAKGWVTKFLNDGVDVSILVQQNSALIQPRGIIEGIVEFEGRTNSNYTVTFDLRERGSYVNIVDSTFYAQNDADATNAGIQYALDNDGKFTLSKVPSGTYDLVVIYDRYLAKKQQISVDAGLDTLFVNFGKMLGGDCIGYTDSTGAAWPNNRIDASDVSRISDAFLSTSANAKWNDGTNNYKWADIDESSKVDVLDLTMATANYTGSNNDGAHPVWAKTVANDNTSADVEISGVPGALVAGKSYTVQVLISGAASVRGYYISLGYDADALAIDNIVKGSFINGSSECFPVVEDGAIGLVNTVYGSSVYSGSGILAEVTFTAKKSGVFAADMLCLTEVSVVNGGMLKETLLNTTTSVNVVPGAFALGQNFPNPFNPTTTISFSVPNASDVTLKVYDVLGRNVRTLVSGSYLPGNYSVVWDARDARGSMVSSGTYFYSITAGNYHSSKRMLFLK